MQLPGGGGRDLLGKLESLLAGGQAAAAMLRGGGGVAAVVVPAAFRRLLFRHPSLTLLAYASKHSQ